MLRIVSPVKQRETSSFLARLHPHAVTPAPAAREQWPILGGDAEQPRHWREGREHFGLQGGHLECERRERCQRARPLLHHPGHLSRPACDESEHQHERNQKSPYLPPALTHGVESIIALGNAEPRLRRRAFCCARSNPSARPPRRLENQLEL